MGKSDLKKKSQKEVKISKDSTNQKDKSPVSNQSRNRVIVSPSQKSTRMKSGKSKASEGQPDLQPDEILEESKSIIDQHESENFEVEIANLPEIHNIQIKEDEKSSNHNSKEFKQMLSSKSDAELISQISKSVSKNEKSGFKPAKSVDSDQEIIEPTEIHQNSEKNEESEGDAESSVGKHNYSNLHKI